MAIDAANPEAIARWGALGFRFFTISMDVEYLDAGARATAAAARAALPR